MKLEVWSMRPAWLQLPSTLVGAGEERANFRARIPLGKLDDPDGTMVTVVPSLWTGHIAGWADV